jgi:UDP:flavonoid glycosyltransferase YjiC (YdhE family)
VSSKPVALLCTSNGVGLGHLSRVMAVGQHLREDFEVVIFTLSAAVSIPVAQGFWTEYLRSHEYSEFDGRQWNSLLEQRLEHLHEIYQPSLLLFDGTHPYAGLCRFLDRHPDLRRAWERRGMWRAGEGEQALVRAQHFDLIVEPGDYAAAYDEGPTASLTDRVERFAPIRYGAVSLTRHDARAELGLDDDATIALVQLGAGQINDVNSLVRHVVDRLVAAGVHIVVAASVLATKPDIDFPGVSVVQKYPISDYFGAFDMGFFAGGYNSFHEALSLQLPSVFVPNLHTKLDDQAARTRFAHDHSLGFDWSDGQAGTLDTLVSRILDTAERDQLHAAMAALQPATGGHEVARRLAVLAGA